MKILIAGGSGFIGKSIIEHLTLGESVEYHVLTRSYLQNHENVHYHIWDGKTLGPWKAYIDQCDVIINLAGKSVNCRYTQTNKKAIYDSRIESTYILGEAIGQSLLPPKLWINASSATIYRDEYVRANTEEDGIIGKGFSEDVALKWEDAFQSAYCPFTRKVTMRMSIVLGAKADVFDIYKTHVKWHLSGRHGKGTQMMSWIHELDLVNAIKHFIQDEKYSGVFNLASPYAVTDKDFLKSFREAMKKPIGIPIPVWALHIGAIYCQSEVELLLKSRWVYPERLLSSGFNFKYKNIKQAIMELLNRSNQKASANNTILEHA